jgi:hypothetical protein
VPADCLRRTAPSGFSTLVAPFISTMMRRENRKDLERLKVLLEQIGHLRQQ